MHNITLILTEKERDALLMLMRHGDFSLTDEEEKILDRLLEVLDSNPDCTEWLIMTVNERRKLK